MNNKDYTAVENTATETVSEYKIGRTTYIVKLVFNPASKEHLTDILQRLIDRECEEMLGESRQEPEKQAV